jgi:anti-sigma B factor antagonist
LAEQSFLLTASSTTARRIDVAGELDLAASGALRAALGGYVDGGGDVTVDLSAVTFLDSTALTVLIQANTLLSASGARLIVAEPSPVVVRVLHLAGVFDILAVTETDL